MTWRLPALASTGCMLILARQPAMTQPLIGLPDYGLVLSGDPQQPTFENRSPKRVIVYTLRLQVLRNTKPSTMTVIREALLAMRNEAFYTSQKYSHEPEVLSIPATGTRQIAITDSERGEGVLSTALDAAVFQDGEFVGPDQGNTFSRLSDMIRAQRDIDTLVLAAHQTGAADSWSQIRTIAGTDVRSFSISEHLYEVRKILAAKDVLNILSVSGDAVAVAWAKSGSVYPTLWRKQ